MAGEGSRFKDSAYVKPKPFIDIDGKPMIVRVLENLYYKEARYILIVREEHLETEKETISYMENFFNILFVSISQLTEGAASTVLFTRELINTNTPLLIANSDQIVDIDIGEFIDDCKDRQLDGSILTFVDNEKNLKWSFASVNNEGYVTEVREKEAISNMATVGIYLYMQGKEYVNAALDMIVHNDRVSNEFYVCPSYNYAIKNKLKIGIYTVASTAMHGVGIPQDLDNYLEFLKQS
jgi:dTDP-glucose pyrophosphorylase